MLLLLLYRNPRRPQCRNFSYCLTLWLRTDQNVNWLLNSQINVNWIVIFPFVFHSPFQVCFLQFGHTVRKHILHNFWLNPPESDCNCIDDYVTSALPILPRQLCPHAHMPSRKLKMTILALLGRAGIPIWQIKKTWGDREGHWGRWLWYVIVTKVIFSFQKSVVRDVRTDYNLDLTFLVKFQL